VRAVGWLRALLLLIAAFHVVAGIGLMFSVPFQRWAVSSYGAHLSWDARDVYFIRIIGSFAFVLGYLAAMAAKDPLKHSVVAIAFVEFFTLRNINRHLYSHELYSDQRPHHGILRSSGHHPRRPDVGRLEAAIASMTAAGN
jgi:hypothetical protein